MPDYLAQLDMSIVTEVLEYGPGKPSPKASVIIVTYNPDQSVFWECLDSLQQQTVKDFEIIVVDNNSKADLKNLALEYNCRYVRLKQNYGLTVGRNVGIKFAKGDIVIFLDDDAIATKNLIEQHINAYEEYDVCGLRGKVLPRTSNIYNYLSSYDDLGEQVMPWLLNMECNISCRRNVVIRQGGFNSTLPKGGGHEGAELTYRIVHRHGDKNKVIYYPNAVVYHDFYGNFKKYLRKGLRHARCGLILRRQVPGLFEFFKAYQLGGKKKNVPLSLFERAKIKLMRILVKSIVVSYKMVLKLFI